MVSQRETAGREGFSADLPRAFAIAKAAGQGADTSDAEVLAALATFNALADRAVAEISSPRRTGEVFTPPEAGGYRAQQSPVVFTLNPADDEAMAAHVQQMAQAGALTSADPSGTGTRAGAALAPSQIPYEDRGRTDPRVQGGANVLDPIGDMPEIPGVSPAIMQWVPVAIWAIRKAGELIARLRNKG